MNALQMDESSQPYFWNMCTGFHPRAEAYQIDSVILPCTEAVIITGLCIEARPMYPIVLYVFLCWVRSILPHTYIYVSTFLGTAFNRSHIPPGQRPVGFSVLLIRVPLSSY